MQKAYKKSASVYRTAFAIVANEHPQNVVHRLGSSEVGRIPVVDRKDPSRLVNVLRRYDIVKAYAKAMSKLPKG